MSGHAVSCMAAPVTGGKLTGAAALLDPKLWTDTVDFRFVYFR